MRYVFVFAAAILACVSFTGTADAASGYASTTLNVRAGPGGGYPLIGRIRSHSALNVHGCTAGWRWCDVSTGPFRGWVAGSYIRTPYRNRTVNLLDFGAALGLPVVTYNERTYWGRNYYDRDFYRTRYGWHNDHRHYGWKRGHHGKWVRDTDRDGIPNYRDRDDDNDGIRDRRDRDDDNDGIRDRYDRNTNYHYNRSRYRYNN